jgi:hypothetical protein
MIQHMVTNHQIDLAGDRAKVRAMFYCSVRIPGVDQVVETGGYYDEDFVRTTEGSKIARLYEDDRWMNMAMPDAPPERERRGRDPVIEAQSGTRLAAIQVNGWTAPLGVVCASRR